MIKELKRLFKKPAYAICLRSEYSEWTPKDAQSLKAFTKSLSGRKFIYMQERSIHNMALEATRATDFHDGIRVGKALVLEDISSMSRSSGEVPSTVSGYALHADNESYT